MLDFLPVALGGGSVALSPQVPDRMGGMVDEGDHDGVDADGGLDAEGRFARLGLGGDRSGLLSGTATEEGRQRHQDEGECEALGGWSGELAVS